MREQTMSTELNGGIDRTSADMESYFDRLWPIGRSLTGDGNRATLKILKELLPLTNQEIPSGSSCFDWTIPPEWRVNRAVLKNSSGAVIADYAKNNLHLVGYSVPFSGRLSLADLRPHLHSLPDQPEAIPYLCSYYKPYWGFCLPHSVLSSLPDDEYEVCIDTVLDEKGSMTLGEAVLPGTGKRDVLISTYICHPSMANNELSGMLLAAFLYRRIARWQTRNHSYRFLFAPETIGAISYLAQHGFRLTNDLAAGYVVTTIGDRGMWNLRKSRRGNTVADRAALLVLEESGKPYAAEDFDINGSDERQYCSPGFNLPVASLTRTRYGRYPEYHTSLDNKSLMSFEGMVETLDLFERILKLIDSSKRYKATVPFCEPMLGKRGLHPSLTTKTGLEAEEMRAMKWVINLSDGNHDPIDIAVRGGLKSDLVLNAITILLAHDLIAEVQ
jgi:aminopeptidase-like protein